MEDQTDSMEFACLWACHETPHQVNKQKEKAKYTNAYVRQERILIELYIKMIKQFDMRG